MIEMLIIIIVCFNCYFNLKFFFYHQSMHENDEQPMIYVYVILNVLLLMHSLTFVEDPFGEHTKSKHRKINKTVYTIKERERERHTGGMRFSSGVSVRYSPLSMSSSTIDSCGSRRNASSDELSRPTTNGMGDEQNSIMLAGSSGMKMYCHCNGRSSASAALTVVVSASRLSDVNTTRRSLSRLEKSVRMSSGYTTTSLWV